MNVNVRLQLGSHSIPLKQVPAELETVYREAGKQLNDRFNYYRRTQPTASAEQLWLYVALEATVNLKSDARDKALEPLEAKMQMLNALISNELKN